jgi:hypothetical protein
MQQLQAFKYELMPNGQQHRQMRRFAGSCRFVYKQGAGVAESALRARREEGPERQLPLSRPEADQARPGQQPLVPAQARLAAVRNTFKRMQRFRAGLLLGYFIELASCMGPASRLKNASTGIQGIEPGIAICLHNALQGL